MGCLAKAVVFQSLGYSLLWVGACEIFKAPIGHSEVVKV